MTTPNTTGQSDEIQRYHHSRAVDDVFASKNGKYVLYSDHLAALSRARDEARREALEEAAKAVEDQWWLDEIGKAAVKIIRALIPNTPQGETKEQQP